MLFLIFAGISEVCMVYCLKRSEGFKNKLWTILMIISSYCSLGGLSLAMNQFDMGIAYSIWVAFGSIGSILLGILAFNEKTTKRQLLFMILIVIAVIGLKLS